MRGADGCRFRCLECVGYSSSAWKSTCSSSSHTTSPSSSSPYSDYASTNGSSGSTSLFGNPNSPLLGGNDGWGPNNTAIVVGSCFGGIAAIALIGIAICLFRRRQQQKQAKTIEDGIERHDEGENNDLTPVLAAQPEVRSEPEHAARSHGSRRERGHQRRGDDIEHQNPPDMHIHPAYDR